MARELVLVIDDSPTITKVVQLVLTKAGYEVISAPDGEAGLIAAREHKPTLILLDFVMPRMNGYQFCRELNADAALKDIPVVLMSAKGDQVGERFVKVMGIVDYITKPFSPEAITAVVQHTITKYRPGKIEDISSLVDPQLLADQDLRATESTAAAAALTEALHAALAATPDGTRSASLDVDAWQRILTSVPASKLLGLAHAQAFALVGELRTVPLAEVLHLLDAQEQSGVLTVVRGTARIDLFFRRGRIDQAVGRNVGEDLLLGRFILDKELMAEADFAAFCSDAAQTALPPAAATFELGDRARLLGQLLVRAGKLSDADLRDCLARQSSELVYEALRWRHGQFEFAAKELPPLVRETNLSLDVEAVLMEGYRRVDEWHLIERVIENFDVVFLRNEDAVGQMGRGRLTREELAVLELVNGKHSIKDIIRKSRMGSFEVSKLLFRLLSVRLIRRRVMPIAV